MCNDSYRPNGWLGLATVYTSGDHITAATTKVNDTYFSLPQYDTDAWRQMVMCQEIGHDFGLGHQDEGEAARSIMLLAVQKGCCALLAQSALSRAVRSVSGWHCSELVARRITAAVSLALWGIDQTSRREWSKRWCPSECPSDNRNSWERSERSTVTLGCGWSRSPASVWGGSAQHPRRGLMPPPTRPKRDLSAQPYAGSGRERSLL